MTFSSSRHEEVGSSQLSMDTRSWQKTERIRYCRKPRSCKATLFLRSDTTGAYYEGTPSHNIPPHNEPINEMKRRESIKNRRRRRGTLTLQRGQSQATSETNVTARRLSADIRFTLLARHGKNTPKGLAVIVFDDGCSLFIIYRTQGNDVVIFGESLLPETQRTHLIFQSTARLANVPAHIPSH